MAASRALGLCNRLAHSGDRRVAARELAEELGAHSLLIFLPDDEVDALLPAPGFPQTLPADASWVALLDRCRKPGRYAGEVGYPDAFTRTPVQALVAASGLTLMLLGGAPRLPDPEEFPLELLHAALRGESLAAAARGALTVEREAARHATALAGALDTTRGELEAALSEAGRLNGALKTAAQERAALLASEQAANRAKDEFLAMLGHELRNPLAPITTALQLIRLRNHDQLEREHEVIERQVTHLTRLVDDLLDVSRIRGGKVNLRKGLVELSTVVLKAVEMASPLLEERHHHFELDVPVKGLLLDADEGRLAQVVSNLLTNAARYTPPGGEISLRASRVGERISVRVRDNGIGIEPALLQSMFDIFVQGRRANDRGDRAEGGLGLGLSIVKSLVALHGGSVIAKSEGPGKGSELILDLPAVPQTDSEAEVERPKPLQLGASRGLRVLVVDDNVDAAELLADALELYGYDVTYCHDGPKALELSGRQPPDVAILDIGLPVMDGIELARRLRTAQGSLPLRLIAATGYGQEADRALTRDAGFDHHLVKPINLASVVELIENGQRR